MPNPFNPLDWIQSAQDWFTRAERSSGFRPYLIYLLLSFGAGLMLVAISNERPQVEFVGLFLLAFPVLCFVLLFLWKAHSDPDFCRSETHVQRLKKIQLESMGTESHQIDGEVYEQQVIEASEAEPIRLEDNVNNGGQA